MRHLPIVVLVFAACAPNPQAPVQVVALVAKTPGSYEPTQVELTTIKDLVGVKGDVAKYVGGARIVISPNDPVNLSDDAYQKFITKNEGGDVHLNLIEKDGVFWPADFDSWNLVTSYFNLEKAYGYFVRAGIPEADLKNSTVYYSPDLVNRGLSSDPIKDNAFFVLPLRGFVLTPIKNHEKVPFAINAGVIAHEYAHKVWTLRVYGGAGNPVAFTTWLRGGVSGAANLVKAMDEGFADYHAYGSTCLSPSGCDPKFISSSVPAALASTRDLSVTNRCLSTADRKTLETQGFGDFTASAGDYKVGSVFAAALYQAGEKSGLRDDLEKALLSAYSDDNPANQGFKQLITSNLPSPELFKLETVANSLLGHISNTPLRKQVCDQLWARLKLDVVSVPNCPSTSSPVADCAGVP